MKSSTIRRSTLSRESMEVIENLAKEQEAEGSLGEYVRPDEIFEEKNSTVSNKSQEIDLLWQNFKTTQFNTNSPTAYILLGFVIGVITTVFAIAGLNAIAARHGAQNPQKSSLFGIESIFSSHKKTPEQTLEQQADNAQEEVNNKVSVPGEDDTAAPVVDASVNNVQEEQTAETSASVDSSNAAKYIVKDGDTGESIIKKHYGSYTPERAERIIKANNLKTLDRLNIDQELLLPVEQ